MVSASRNVAGQPSRDRDQQPVTRLMAQGVVDVLEVVEIDEQRGPDRAVATTTGEQLIDPVDDQRPVGQAGQRIVQRLMAQFAVRRATRRRARSRPVARTNISAPISRLSAMPPNSTRARCRR